MIHNHPSGTQIQSHADGALNNRLSDIFPGTGLEFMGSVVVSTGGTLNHVPPNRVPDRDQDTAERIGPARRTGRVPVESRELRRSGGTRSDIQNARDMKRYVECNHPNNSGVV